MRTLENFDIVGESSEFSLPSGLQTQGLQVALWPLGVVGCAVVDGRGSSASFQLRIQRQRKTLSVGTWCRRIRHTVLVESQPSTSFDLASPNSFRSWAPKVEIFTSLLCLFAAETKNDISSVQFPLSSCWCPLHAIDLKHLVFLQMKNTLLHGIQTLLHRRCLSLESHNKFKVVDLVIWSWTGCGGYFWFLVKLIISGTW